MLLLLLRKKQSSSFAGSSMCSNVRLSTLLLEFFFVPETIWQPRDRQPSALTN